MIACLIIACVAAISLVPAAPPVTPSAELAAVRGVPTPRREQLHLDPFYQRYVDDRGLPILASRKCSPYALVEARDIIDHMLAHRPEVRAALIERHVRVMVMASDEATTDVPEQRDMRPKAYWNRRARGLGGSLVSCGEENLLRYPGDPYWQENILIHELSHAIQDLAMGELDPTFGDRVQAAYDASARSGAWDHSYAASNVHEYFAEGAQAWFDAGRPAPDRDANNGIATREAIKRADPKLAALLAEVFGDEPWRYVPPDCRRDPGDLAGLDRRALPTFNWPD